MVTPNGKPDIVSYTRILERLAKENHPEALCLIGQRMMNDVKNPNQKFQGVDYIRRSAELGSPKGMFLYGTILKNNQKYEEAFKYLKLASEQGQIEALDLLGVLYQEGLYSKDRIPNDKLAFECYLEAAQNGLAIAQHNVAAYYFSGIESKDFKLERNVDFALDFWRLAAIQDFDLACMNLVKHYTTGKDRDYDLAEKYLRKIISLGSQSVVFKEAQIYLKELDTLRIVEPMSV